MTATNKVVIQGEDVRGYENRKKEGNAGIIKISFIKSWKAFLDDTAPRPTAGGFYLFFVIAAAEPRYHPFVIPACEPESRLKNIR
jgi:hypothetical protein